jgi:hypothetical protein
MEGRHFLLGLTLLAAQVLLDNDVLAPSPITLVALLLLLTSIFVVTLLIEPTRRYKVILKLYFFLSCNRLLLQFLLHCFFFLLQTRILSDFSDGSR